MECSVDASYKGQKCNMPFANLLEMISSCSIQPIRLSSTSLTPSTQLYTHVLQKRKRFIKLMLSLRACECIQRHKIGFVLIDMRNTITIGFILIGIIFYNNRFYTNRFSYRNIVIL